MIEVPRRSPTQVSALGAAPIPRWGLLALLAIFIVPGLFGHDLWPQDATGFGRMWTMAHGSAPDWLVPNVLGSYVAQGGPLPDWVGALLIKALGGWVGEAAAATAGNLIWYPLGLMALWMAVFRLARRDEAQPVASAFGGGAGRVEYARLIADIAVMLAVGTIGTLLRLHRIEPDGASFTCVSLALLAVGMAESQRRAAAALAGTACGAFALTQGAWIAVGLLGACVGAILTSAKPETGERGSSVRAALLCIAIALAIACAWPLAALHWYPRQAQLLFDGRAGSLTLGWPSHESLGWLLRTGAWFFWPAWPLAAWAVYAWRSSLGAAHLLRPLLLLAGLLLTAIFSASLDEHALVAMIPAMVTLAALGATALRRALDNVIDWFAMAIFSLALVFFWAYYGAMQTGAPKPMAASIARLAPGFTPRVHDLMLATALVVTLAWVQLLIWRIRRRPQVLWRGAFLAAAGISAVWIVANALFLPAVDYALSYRSFARELATELRSRGIADGCVQAHRVAPAERALLAYYGKLRFDRDDSPETCRFALHHDARRSSLDEDPPPGVRGMWELAWEGRRRARPEERWRIWARTP